MGMGIKIGNRVGNPLLLQRHLHKNELVETLLGSGADPYRACRDLGDTPRTTVPCCSLGCCSPRAGSAVLVLVLVGSLLSVGCAGPPSPGLGKGTASLPLCQHHPRDQT